MIKFIELYKKRTSEINMVYFIMSDKVTK